MPSLCVPFYTIRNGVFDDTSMCFLLLFSTVSYYISRRARSIGDYWKLAVRTNSPNGIYKYIYIYLYAICIYINICTNSPNGMGEGGLRKLKKRLRGRERGGGGGASPFQPSISTDPVRSDLATYRRDASSSNLPTFQPSNNNKGGRRAGGGRGYGNPYQLPGPQLPLVPAGEWVARCVWRFVQYYYTSQSVRV
jgi:hypothetical protein